MLLAVACTPETQPPPVVAPPAGPVVFGLAGDRFDAEPALESADLFDVVTADADLDGDQDLLVNRHLDTPWEWFENQGDGTFVLRNVPGEDRSGLWDNVGIPTIFADASAMDAAIGAGEPAVTIWHDLDRSRSWHLDVPAELAPLALDLEVSRPIVDLEGADEIVARTDTTASLVLAGAGRVRLRNELIGTGLHVVTTPPVPISVGPDLVPYVGEVELWKPDPHGMAWVDALGTPEPDLYVCRGGLTGLLVPPARPKHDQLFEWIGAGTTYAEVPLEPGYGRGRQVAWADLDGDGVDELYVSDTDTADQVLDPDGAGGFVDRAAQWGLELVADDTFAVTDLDDDGWLDLISGQGRTLRVMHRRGDRFVETPGPDLGLAWPEGFTTTEDGIFNPLGLQLADVDRDGDLDLVAADDEEVRLFLRDGGAFTDAGDVGFPVPVGPPHVAPFDADLDGDVDVAIASAELWLALNDGTGRFTGQRLDAGWPVPVGRAALAADVDGDGREDLVVVTSTDRLVATNETPSADRALRIHPDLPRGTRIVAVLEDGAELALQWGANAVSRYSQGTKPLVVGTPEGRSVVGLRVRRPGQPEEELVTVPEGAEDLEL